MFCPKCEVYICDTREAAHTSNIFSRNHKLENLKEQKSDGGRLDSVRKRRCSIHPSENLTGFCFGCSIFVCVNCLLGEHKGHQQKVHSLEESVLKKRGELLKVGLRLKKRLGWVEKTTKEIEEELKLLEEEMVRKKSRKKEFELEKEDLSLRYDTIIRLSETPTGDSIFKEDTFSTLMQTANNLVSDLGYLMRNRGIIQDDITYFETHPCPKQSWGMIENTDNNLIIGRRLSVRNSDGSFNRNLLYDERLIDVAIGLEGQIVALF